MLKDGQSSASAGVKSRRPRTSFLLGWCGTPQTGHTP